MSLSFKEAQVEEIVKVSPSLLQIFTIEISPLIFKGP
jgi:hypothetical protein